MYLKTAGWSFPAFAVLMALFSEGITARAATTDSWTNAGSGLWATPSNWSENLAPDPAFSLVAITNSGSKTVTIDGATPAATLWVQRLTVAAPPGALNTLELVDASPANPLLVSGTLSLQSGGWLRVTNSAVEAGILEVTGGGLALESGTVTCSPAGAVKVSSGSTGAGTIHINGGVVSLEQLQVGALTGSEGVLNLNDGLLEASSLVTLGMAFNSTGRVRVAGGRLLATNDLVRVGNLGTGHLLISGGSATFAFLSTGENEGAAGKVEVTGGELRIMPRNENDLLRVGSRGLGELNISGGTHLVGSELHLADWANATGLVSVVGGTLVVTNNRTTIGRLGYGEMVVSNSFVQLTNVSVGRHAGAWGALVVQSNGIVEQLDDLSIGRFAGAEGRVFVEGGTLALTGEVVWVGREGTGELNLSDGLVSARTFFVGMSPDGSNAPAGKVSIAGGTLVASSNIVIGTPLISAGEVVVGGGRVLVTGKEGPGYVALNNGTLSVANADVSLGDLLMTNSTGQMLFNSGRVRLKNATVANGAAFVVGDGINPATLELLGGTYSFADGLVVSPNASVTGCGTIVGQVVNQGTIATNCSTGQAVVITLSCSPPEGGTTTGSGTYAGGTNVWVTAAPSPGYVFLNWSENGTPVSSSPSYSFEAAADRNLVATFAANTGFPVWAESDGENQGVSFVGLAGFTYVLEYKDTLNDGEWTAILPGTAGTGGRMTLSGPAPTGPTRFYRVRSF